MASAALTPPRADWALANPWLWTLTGLATSGAALLCTLSAGELIWMQYLLLGLGLAGMAAALCLRFRSGIEGPSVRYPRIVLLAFAGLNGLLALAAVYGMFIVFYTLRQEGFDLGISLGVIFWMLLCAWFGTAALYFAQRQDGQVSARMAGSALLVVLAAIPFLTSWALYTPKDPQGWDSMRMFFGVLGGVLLGASVLVGLVQWLRRLVFSALVLFHFGGILTAVMGQTPGPWVSQYLWIRVYEPYLEFMYLVNAYRFYSPEPSPAWHAWFFVEYEDGNLVRSRWVKLPDVDSEGTPNTVLRLRYQRRIAMNENIAQPSMVTPQLEYIDAHGVKRPAPFVLARYEQGPRLPNEKPMLGAENKPPVLGRPVPYHPDMSVPAYSAPSQESERILRAYARHVARLPHPDHPGLKATSVKVYRVRHRTLLPLQVGAGVHPNSLMTYLPYYLGKYDPDGNLMDKEDPFLYWLLPVMPEQMDPTLKANEVRRSDVVSNYAILHAYGGEENIKAIRNMLREQGKDPNTVTWKFRVRSGGQMAGPAD